MATPEHVSSVVAIISRVQHDGGSDLAWVDCGVVIRHGPFGIGVSRLDFRETVRRFL